MIYLICNTGYGRPFIDTLAELHRRTGIAATLVFSGRSDVPKTVKRVLAGPLRRVRRRLQERRLSRQYGVPVAIVENINSRAFLDRIAPQDCALIAGFNQILKSETIGRFRLVVNFHPSLLPLYRGPVPSYWCLVNGETQSGFTLHRVTERIDNGAILYQEAIPIHDLKSEDEVDQRIAGAGAAIFARFLDEVVVRNGPWSPLQVNAFDIYKHHIDYRGFPGRKVHG